MGQAEIIKETGTDELLCSVHERVATITLNRPQARNSLSDNLTPALRTMIKICGDDATIGAIRLPAPAPYSAQAATSRAWAERGVASMRLN